MSDDRKPPEVSTHSSKLGSTSVIRSQVPIKVTLKYEDGGQIFFKMHPGFEVQVVQGTTPYSIQIDDLDTPDDLRAVD